MTTTDDPRLLFAQAQLHARTTPARGLGKVFPGSSTDVLHFLCCFMCCFLRAHHTGKGSKEECSTQSPLEPSLGSLPKACGRAGTMSIKSNPLPGWEREESLLPRLGMQALCFTGSHSTTFSPMLHYDAMALNLKQA
ncbi:uncharacterized protein [Macaca nemestrina]|uniref:uncharacterized protein isoform X3 n=1 Tax=Macaca nemestrina TaxID=9545 RepID=UPI0039B9CDB0